MAPGLGFLTLTLIDEKFSLNSSSRFGASSTGTGGDTFGDDAFLCHHLSLAGGGLGGKLFGNDEFIRAGGGETAREAARFALKYSVG